MSQLSAGKVGRSEYEIAKNLGKKKFEKDLNHVMAYFTKQFDDYRLNFPLDDGEGESERDILVNTMRLMNFIIMIKKEILGKTENSENLSNILRNGLTHSNDKSYDRLFLRCEKAFPSTATIPESGNSSKNRSLA